MPECCDATARHFDEERVAREARSLNRKGPGVTTSTLLELLVDAGVDGAEVLDVGAGLGAASLSLVEAGAARATLLDASAAYARRAMRRVRERGLEGRVEYRVGDFLERAPSVDSAEVVVLDRVLCCDPRLEHLVDAAAGKADRLLAASYPRNRLTVRAFIASENLLRRLRGSEFRVWVHSVEVIRKLLADRGFELRGVRRTFVWEMGLYVRSTSGSPRP